MKEYSSALNELGIRTIPGSNASLWASYETRWVFMRMPTFHLIPPAREEVLRTLRSGRAAVASFLTLPDEERHANAWLYVCTDRQYSMEKLPKAAQRCVRRAQRELLFRDVNLSEMLDRGFAAYRDTYQRIGLTSGGRGQFERAFRMFYRNPAHRVVGAWSEADLAAYMMLVVVDDWVEIPGSFSADAHLGARPNDGLANHVLHHFLVESRCKTVSYGLSSIEANAETEGLHVFKQKLGFEAVPVHRVFALHPFVRPAVNRTTLRGVKAALRLYPGARLLRKAEGVLKLVLEK